MNQEINPNDALSDFDKPKLPTALNVLTILTIIGCVFLFLSEIWGFSTAKKSYEESKTLIESGKLSEQPKFVQNMMSPEMLAMQKKRLDNKLPILILGLVGGGLCLYGAMEMRKRKKQGYTFWLIGELLPVATTLLFIGTTAFAGFALLFWLFPIVFIILYTVNKKYLVY